MFKFLTIVALVMAFAFSAQAVTILSEDFETWNTGTIDGSYVLPAGWVNSAVGAPWMDISTSQNHTAAGTKSLHVPAGTSDISLRYVWYIVDPVAADQLTVTYWGYKAAGKVQKGAGLYNQYALAGLCAPIIQWYTNTADSTLSRIRARRNCAITSPPDPPAGNVYDVVQNLQFAQDSGAWHEWKAVLQDVAPGAAFTKDGGDLHGGTNTFGVPFLDFDNMTAIEFGDFHAQPWSDTDLNGEMWYDDIVITGPAPPAVEDWATY